MAAKKIVKVTKVVKRRAPAVHTVSKTRDAVDEALDAAVKRLPKKPPREPDEVVPARPRPPALPRALMAGLVDELVKTTGPAGKVGTKAVSPGRAVVLGDGSAVRIPGVISTQVPSLDAAIGRGGWPMGRVCTLTSDQESAGKSSLLLHGLAEAQARGGLGLFIEKENKVDSSLVSAIIGDAPNIVLSKPPYLERAFDVIERTLKRLPQINDKQGRKVPCFIGVDSLDGFDVKDEYDLEVDARYSGTPIAPVPKVMSRNLPRLTEVIEKEHATCVWICQSRSKVNVKFGRKTDQTGGKALKFHSALIVNVAYVGKILVAKNAIGVRIKAMVTKNNVARPFLATEFDYIFGKGADLHSDLVAHAIALGVMEKSGAWISHEGERVGQGVRGAAHVLERRADWTQRILAEVGAAEQEARREGRAVARVMTDAEKAGVEEDVAEGSGDS